MRKNLDSLETPLEIAVRLFRRNEIGNPNGGEKSNGNGRPVNIPTPLSVKDMEELQRLFIEMSYGRNKQVRDAAASFAYELLSKYAKRGSPVDGLRSEYGLRLNGLPYLYSR